MSKRHSSAKLAQKIFKQAAEGKKLAEKRKRELRKERMLACSFPFQQLPFDIQEMILRYLPAAEIGKCPAVSKSWGHIYQGAVASIFAKVVGVARGRSNLMRRAELQLIHRLRNTHANKSVAIETALWAAFNGYNEYVIRLVNDKKNQLEVNQVGSEEWDHATLLHVACRQGNAKLVRSLLDMGANPACTTKSKQTPLILACEYGFDTIVNILLERCGRDVDANAQDSSGRAALFAACDKGYAKIVDILVDWGEMIQQETGEEKPILDLNLGTLEKGSPLCTACRCGQSSIARRLLASQVNVNARTEDGRTALYCAVERGAINTTKLLLEKRPAIGQSEMAKLLYEARPHHGMDAAVTLAETETEVPNTPACSAGVLIDFPANTGKTAVFVAAERGNENLLQVLIDAGADTNKPTFLNKTPLYAAAENGHGKVVKQLLNYCTRENVLHQTNFGTNALFMAQRNGNLQIKTLLSDFCVEKLTVEKAKKRKSKRKQNDAMTRLYAKKEKKPQNKKQLPEGEKRPLSEEEKKSRIDKDVERSRNAVEELIQMLNHIEVEVHEEYTKIENKAAPLTTNAIIPTPRRSEASPRSDSVQTPAQNESDSPTDAAEETMDPMASCRDSRAKYFEEKFKGKGTESRLVPKKEKEVLAARKWSEKYIEEKAESETEDSRQEDEMNTSVTLSMIRKALLNFSSLTSNYKMSDELFEKSFEDRAESMRPTFELIKGNKGVANGWDLFVGLTLSCESSREEKLGFCFGLFDAKSEGFVEKSVAKSMLRCCTKAVKKLKHAKSNNEGSEPKEDLDQLVKDLAKFDVEGTDFDQDTIEQEQFVEWAMNSRMGTRLFGTIV
mmetsp:Transcript_14056/g.30424  ORF Transcript_14056/g.30424 Transcript_14056/m.30424 type:complete len:845 (-) Transcript_14056:2742-5276(-)